MASFTNVINKGLLDSILPIFGNQREQMITWDNGQKMFIYEEYESFNGNRYYSGFRFCDRVVVVEKVGLFHNWTYIDSIELYAFNGKKRELIQKRDYNKVFRNEEFIRNESETMVRDYIYGVYKTAKLKISDEEVVYQARLIIDKCYKSFLDKDYDISLLKEIVKEIEQK